MIGGIYPGGSYLGQGWNGSTSTGGVAGNLAATEAADTFAASGKVLVKGTLTTTEGADSLAGTGKVIILGTLAATEAADSFAGAGTVLIQGALAATEAADSLASTGKVIVQGALAATEAADSLASTGKVIVQGDLAATEAADSFAGTGVSNASFTITGADAALLYKIAQLHGLYDTMRVTTTARTAGEIIQRVSTAGTTTRVSTTSSGGDTVAGLPTTWIEDLAAVYGLTGDTVVTPTGRAGPGVSQTFTTFGDATVVARV